MSKIVECILNLGKMRMTNFNVGKNGFNLPERPDLTDNTYSMGDLNKDFFLKERLVLILSGEAERSSS